MPSGVAQGIEELIGNRQIYQLAEQRTLSIQRLPCSSHNMKENAEQTASLFQESHIRSQAARRYCLGSRQHSAKFLPLLPDRHRRCVVLGRNIDGMFDQPHLVNIPRAVRKGSFLFAGIRRQGLDLPVA
jgi:hypothetical protein